ncbi:MAG TPA: bifunctional DNA-binding transcriptional regulator/O6-methylguanine-DNA methyltransferase Ada [Pyrinomonadaceae bacterium]|nr:bifunctional DNA-binding transcriptional regulator/O6-methylguanine-DNA methyltransferase Ada [Pyrinomonadaceae bacterium]
MKAMLKGGDMMSAQMKEQINLLPDADEAKWQAVTSKDARADGQFVFAVSSTGIYCRPSCPSRRPLRKNVSFFPLPEAAEQAGFRACLRCHPQQAQAADPQIEMVRQVCRIIEAKQGELITLAELGDQIGVSAFHLQRTFKSIMGISPSRYAEGQRINRFKTKVRSGESIASATYDAGFGSSSRLYEGAATQLGMTPATYGKGGRGAIINYAIVDCSLGKLLVAATSKGVCSVALGGSEEELQTVLANEFPAAEIRRDDEVLAPFVASIVKHFKEQKRPIELPLDIRATSFQQQVWAQLRRIPVGETLSYSEVARAIGQEKAVRAVARACATNPVALVIPCHRVIREDKNLGGYRWGLKRKKKLLQSEREAAKS